MDQKERIEFILKNKVFWACLAIIIILPTVGVLSSKTSPELEKAVQGISFMQKGKELAFEVKVNGIQDMTFTFLEDVKNSFFKIEEVSKTSWDFEGTIYSRFKVSSDDPKLESKIGDVRFTLKLKEAELKKLGLKVEEVKLYNNGKELETNFFKRGGEYVYYNAHGSDFGEFVIGKAPVAAKKEEVVEEKPLAEEKPLPPQPEEPTPLVDKAAEQPTPKEGAWSKITSFFKNLFQ